MFFFSFVAEHPITFLVRHRVGEDKVPAFLNFVEAVARVSQLQWSGPLNGTGGQSHWRVMNRSNGCICFNEGQRRKVFRSDYFWDPAYTGCLVIPGLRGPHGDPSHLQGSARA